MFNYKKKFQSAYFKVFQRLWKDSEKFLASEQSIQMILKNQYKQLAKTDISNHTFDDVGFRKYSQNTEDGILLFIFSIIGTTNKFVVEICAGDGIQCNAANLIVNHGWRALLVDGQAEKIAKGKKFYRTHPDTFTIPPKMISSWITRDNVNKLMVDNDVPGQIDLLSIDMDGVDYWIWKAIDKISPRVVVAEVQMAWGSERSVTVPYAEDFKSEYIKGFGAYCGASVNAFVSLAKSKGYRLIGFEKFGFNAFFVRNDVGQDIFPEISLDNYEEIYLVNWAKKELLPMVKDLEWQEV